MLGCGCGILFPVPCDSVIPKKKLAGDVGVTAQDSILQGKQEK